jgi:hypothetical protein
MSRVDADELDEDEEDEEPEVVAEDPVYEQVL